MARRRFAIITYDPDRVEGLNWQAEGNNFAYIIREGLCGRDYPRERGIDRITLLDRVPVKGEQAKRSP